MFVKFLPVCVLVWRFRSKVSLKPFPQKVQRYLLVSLWHFMCRFSSRCRVNCLEHVLHWNLDGSESGLTGGSFSSVLTIPSGDIGFLNPWPPLISSMGASGGMPSCNGEICYFVTIVERFIIKCLDFIFNSGIYRFIWPCIKW